MFKKNFRLFSGVLLGVWMLLAAGSASVSADTSQKSFSDVFADASVRLLQRTMAVTDSNKNILISPDSILSLLTLAENGTAGSTRTQMEQALGGLSAKKYSRSLLKLHIRLSASSGASYQTANSIWYKNKVIKVKKSFIKKAKKDFKAELYAAPFTRDTVRKINNWVSKKTNGKITKIVDRFSPEARLCLLNAVYFKGNWEAPYSSTVKRRFTASSGKKTKVPMLEGTERTYVTAAGGDGFIKYYQGGQFAFMALLPPRDMTVRQYVKKLSGSKLMAAYKNRETSGIKVYTRMPEFEYEFDLSLKKPLMKMGIRSIFSDGADFSKMTDSPVKVDDVLHKTYIKLDKQGTEAAAVTGMFVKATAFRQSALREKTVYLNRPFVYAILDTTTGIPVFLGILNQA